MRKNLIRDIIFNSIIVIVVLGSVVVTWSFMWSPKVDQEVSEWTRYTEVKVVSLDVPLNFERVFVSFFANGEGTLKMEENTDPLESNIEIMVRPKGKQMQTISLLSGGEKTLTAISLLFSIYLVKPSPFCILDEIDAPLDDVNIGRFTTALKDFSNETQFIVVTHNKRTMESADTLYGVTMEEEGLSKEASCRALSTIF